MLSEKLYNELKEIIGDNIPIYFQPPTNTRIQYPCIICEFSKPIRGKANNSVYTYSNEYMIKYITKDIDDVVTDKLLRHNDMEYSQFFKTEGLCHYVFQYVSKN